MFKKFAFVAVGRIASIAVALVLLTAAPAAQANLFLHALEEAGKVTADGTAKAGVRAGEVTVTGAKMENKVGGVEVKGASVEPTAVKFEGGGGGESGGSSGDDAPPWFKVLCAVGVGGWLLWKLQKFIGKRA
jgi:hypothetical protein